MSDPTALYQEVILDHNRSPRNWGELPGATRTIEGHNPLCGDQLTLAVRFEGDVIADVKFVGEGCAISKASASMMTQAIKGKTLEEADALFERFHALVTGHSAEPATTALGKLKVFAGVARFPTRVKCASLAWHALREAMEGQSRSPAPSSVDVGAFADIPESGLLSVHLPTGEQVCLVRQGDDVRAYLDECPHAGMPLSAGELVNGCDIECAWHGARFDAMTGEVDSGPATEGLTAFEATVVSGRVLVGARRAPTTG